MGAGGGEKKSKKKRGGVSLRSDFAEPQIGFSVPAFFFSFVAAGWVRDTKDAVQIFDKAVAGSTPAANLHLCWSYRS